MSQSVDLFTLQKQIKKHKSFLLFLTQACPKDVKNYINLIATPSELKTLSLMLMAYVHGDLETAPHTYNLIKKKPFYKKIKIFFTKPRHDTGIKEKLSLVSSILPLLIKPLLKKQ